MELPQYVTVDEVKRVCKELGIRDWTELKEPVVLPEEAKVILSEVNTKGMKINVDDFRQGLEVELEHGTMYEDANVTNNHPILTGKIVLAHLKEALDYYKRLDVAEIEGDLLKAMLSKDLSKIESKYRKLAEAQQIHQRISHVGPDSRDLLVAPHPRLADLQEPSPVGQHGQALGDKLTGQGVEHG